MSSQKSDLAKAFKGKTILVTGHTGFKGAWLSLWLSALGANVIGYSEGVPTHPSFYESTRLSKRITDLRGDIRDGSKMMQTVEQHSPEFVFHLAAQPLVRDSYLKPIETFEINVIGTANVLEAVRSNDCVKVCICVTSDKCYENMGLPHAYKEDDRLGGDDPYSASKAAAEIVITSYQRSFFTGQKRRDAKGLASARAGNVIGGGDWARDRIVPDCIRAISAGRPVVLRNPTSVRPWQHVMEALSGYLLLAVRIGDDPQRCQGAWNFGPPSGPSLTVSELVDRLLVEWGSGKWNVEKKKERDLPESRTLNLDSSKACDELGWSQTLSIDESIRLTAEWYKAFVEGSTDLEELSLQQIRSFVKTSRFLKSSALE